MNRNIRVASKMAPETLPCLQSIVMTFHDRPKQVLLGPIALAFVGFVAKPSRLAVAAFLLGLGH